ncbi:MAG: SUMF1/EgtB/PvdO family nonheme iron enzyme, partial [Planctomycetes bacterium]|nr:SUMF1/EgtB/PvdO family nonheme iron enzyme [Planctomycetota bacterium]
LDVDTRTDIYSLGVLLYELLSGCLPFDPETFHRSSLADIQRIIRDEDPIRPSSRVVQAGTAGGGAPSIPRERAQALRRQLRGDLDWIVMKAMAKDRTRRYGSALDLAADIRRHLADEPVLAGPPGIGYRLRKLTRKHRGAVAVGLAIILGAAAVIGALRIRAASAFRGSLASARAAIAGRDLGAARASLSVLLEAHANRADVKALAREVDALETALLAEESARILGEAERRWGRYRTLRGGLGDVERAWEARRLEQPSWAPPWEREEEFALHAKLETLRREIDDAYDDAMIQFQRAIEIAPPESDAARAARAACAVAMRALYETALEEGPVGSGAEFFRRRGAALDPAAFGTQGGMVALRVEPSDAAVYCFRFDEREKRRIPVAFDARAGIATEPPLEIERVFDAPSSPFEGGDRILRVAGEDVKRWGDLARVLATVGADTPVNVLVERAGDPKTVSWIPFPGELYARFETDLPERDRETLRPGRMLCPRLQFGFALRAFPIAPKEACRLDADPNEGGFRVHLPDGSYLFLFRRPGHADLRIPVQIAGRDREVDARLLAEDEIPTGFVYIPPGPVPCGGDALAFQSLPFGEEPVGGFSIGRLEVTFAEYLAFLNDPIEAIGEDGTAVPASEYVRRYVTEILGGERIDLIPRWDSDEPLVVRDGSGTRWVIRSEEVKSEAWPVFGISQFAAREYAHWRTEKREAGGRWRYRLPTDLEWEKAARGADRRVFVWGDYPLWYYSWTYRGIFWRSKTPEDVGLSSADESVYGVRDLTGSVSEHAIGRPSPPFRYESLRGGNWFNTDDTFGRVATRNGRLPWKSGHNTGFRLVAERRD